MRNSTLAFSCVVFAVLSVSPTAPARAMRTGDAPCDLVSEFSGGAWVGANCDNQCVGENDCHVITIKAVSSGHQIRLFSCSGCDGLPVFSSDCHGTAWFDLTAGTGGADCAGNCTGTCAGNWNGSGTLFWCACN